MALKELVKCWQKYIRLEGSQAEKMNKSKQSLFIDYMKVFVSFIYT